MTKTAKQMIINMCGLAVTLLSQWFISIILPKVGGFEEAGILTISFAVGNTLLTFAIYGMRTIIVADDFVSVSKKDYIYFRILTIGISTGLCVLFVIIKKYGMYEAVCIFLYWGYRIISSLIDLYSGFWQNHEKLDWVGYINCADGIWCIISFVVAYYMSHNLVFALFMMVLFSGLMVYLPMLIIDKKFFAYKVCCTAGNNILVMLIKYFPLMVANLLPVIINSMPKVILQSVSNNYFVGIFGSLSAPLVLVTTFTNGLVAPFIKRMARYKADNNFRGLNKLIVILCSIITTVVAMIFVVSMFFVDSLLFIIFGDEIVGYSSLFLYLVVAIYFNALSMVFMNVLIILDERTKIMICTTIATVIGGIVSYFLILTHGIKGASFCMIVSYMLLFIMLLGVFMLYQIKNEGDSIL